MPEYKPYYYYAKNDLNKEAIDKVLAFDFESALMHFSERKQMDGYVFLTLFEIVNSYETESK
jgi:predicted transcriptional regulator